MNKHLTKPQRQRTIDIPADSPGLVAAEGRPAEISIID